MSIQHESIPLISRADLLWIDDRGKSQLLVEVKGVTPVPDSVVQLLRTMRHYSIPFGIMADPFEIRVFDRTSHETGTPRLVLGVDSILDAYDGRDPSERDSGRSETYTTSLIDSWLRDLVSRWRHPSPPELDALTEIGLVSQLQDAESRREAPLGRLAVR